MAEGSGWVVTGLSAPGAPLQVNKPVPTNANGQHIVYGLDVSFSAAPASPSLCQLVDPDISPNPVLWEGYLAAAGIQRVEFVRGLTITAKHQVALLVAGGGGSVRATASIHGITR